MEKTRVFLSDPQVLFREGIHFILSGEEDFDVTGETTGNEDAYAAIITNPPHIALLSMEDEKTSGADITRRIKRNLPTVAVLMTIQEKTTEALFNAMKSGVSACITKNTDPDYLLDLIRVIAQGSHPIIEEMLTPEMGELLLAEFKHTAALNEQLGNLLPDLVPREVQLINSIAAGNDMEQIAEKLAMNEGDIRRSLRVTLNKLISIVQAGELIKAVQQQFPSGTEPGGSEYVTRIEFNEFKARIIDLLQPEDEKAGRTVSRRRMSTR